MTNRGVFTGLCYICGEWVNATYCREHASLAEHARMPLRTESRNRSTADLDRSVKELTRTVTHLTLELAKKDRIIHGWRTLEQARRRT